MKILKVPVVHISIISLITFLLAFLFNLSVSDPYLLLFTKDVSPLIFTFASLGMAFMFFGYGTPFMMLLAGLYSGYWYLRDPFIAVLFLFIAFLSAYLSIRFGTSLLRDLQGKGTFRKEWKPLSTVLFVLVIFAIILEFNF